MQMRREREPFARCAAARAGLQGWTAATCLLFCLSGQGIAADESSPSFLNEVVPLLTKLGCNQGSCHGKLAGQNGFRLSLRGYAPEWDHGWLTRELSSRRVNLAFPEASLVLRKPLGLVPHRAGVLFRAGSREHAVLLAWIRAGAPGPSKQDPSLTRLQVLPGSQTLEVGDAVELTARAAFSDGSSRDVTWLTRFESNDASILEVEPSGKGRVLRHGETSVRASFLSEVAVALVTVPRVESVEPALYASRNNFIDDHVFAKLAALRIEPSGDATDAEFIRRATLDSIGRLPTAGEMREFLADGRPDKRSRLAGDLLERPEFVDLWTLDLSDLLQNRKERDHDVRGTKGVRAFHDWLRQQVARNRPWNELARDILTAQGKTTENPAVGYYVVTVGEERHADRSEAVASVAQAMLGTRIICAKCHNHPLERYTQDDYYHFAAFFSRLKLERKDSKEGPTSLLVSMPNSDENKRPVGVSQPRTGVFLAPQPLDRKTTKVEPGDDPRVKLADWVTDPSNEYFSGAMVNRIWKRFFGVGLVEPVDDLRESNPPSNPALWKALLLELTSHGYDRKHLVRMILSSRAYQLSSATTPANEGDLRFYSHFYLRRLPAEVLLDALAQATGVPDAFPGYPVGIRALQLPDPTVGSYFLTIFGRSERVTACACERNGEVTIAQLLHMQNGESVVQKINRPGGRLKQLLARSSTDPEITDPEIIEELYLASVSRRPEGSEIAEITSQLSAGDDREDVFKDLFWALLNTKEFAFNH